MLPKSKKLTRALFSRNSGPKKTWAGAVLRIQQARLNTNTPRFSVVVPKKLCPLAVKRNAFKRQVFRVIVEIESAIKGSEYNVFIITPTKKTSMISNSAIRDDMNAYVNLEKKMQ